MMLKLNLKYVSAVVLAVMLGLSFFNLNSQKSFAQYDYKFPLPSNHSMEGQSEFDATVKFYLLREKRDPSSFHDKAILAQYYLSEAKVSGREDYYDKAKEYAFASLQLMPVMNAAAIKVLADHAQAQHQFKEAIQYANRLLKEKPNSAEATMVLISSYLALGELNEANRFADSLVFSHPSENSYTMRASVLAAQGRYEEAMLDFNQAFKQEEDDVKQAVWTRAIFGRFCVTVGLYGLAENVLVESLRLNPKFSFSLYELGQLHLKTKHPKRAIGYFQAAFRESKQLLYLYGEARAYKEKGDTAYSISLTAQIEALLRDQLKRNNTAAHSNELTRLLLERGLPKDIQEALALVETESKKRADADTLLLLSWAHEENNHPLLAQKIIREMLSKNMNSPDLFMRASSVETKLNNQHLANIYRKKSLVNLAGDF